MAAVTVIALKTLALNAVGDMFGEPGVIQDGVLYGVFYLWRCPHLVKKRFQLKKQRQNLYRQVIWFQVVA